jgi:hypothetical protein
MKRLLQMGFVVAVTSPLYVQAQQPNMAQLKTDAQKVVGIISKDEAKAKAFCQMRTLGEQIDQSAHEKGRNEAEALIKEINALEKQLGPEYLALIDSLSGADPNSKDVQEILLMFDNLDRESCPR